MDIYGRTLAYVFGTNKVESLNERMIKEGLGMWYKWQAGCESYQAMETNAKNATLGFYLKAPFFCLTNTKNSKALFRI